MARKRAAGGEEVSPAKKQKEQAHEIPEHKAEDSEEEEDSEQVNTASTSRTIHITGGHGGARCAKMEGKCDLVLPAGAGIAELKKLIRQKYVSMRRTVRAQFTHTNAAGSASPPTSASRSCT
jgi:hypothetical protein